MYKTLSLCFFIFVNSTYAQTFQIGSGTSSSLYGPIYIYSSGSPNIYSWNLSLYPQSEILTAGAFPGAITNISWNKVSDGAYLTPDATFQIYLKHSSLQEFVTAADFNVEVVGATMVYENTAMSLSADTGWINFPLTTQFNWNGTDNIMVLTSWSRVGVATNPVSWQATATAPLTLLSHSFNDTTSMGTLYTNGNRPNVRLEFNPATSVNQHGSELEIQIFPNPAKDFLEIRKLDPTATLILRDITGRLVLNKFLPYGRYHTVRLPELSAGSYIVQIMNENGSVLSKVLIE
ncbi:MAG: T9SS type A sorting domain-containing protein [Bacteroidia bacterium]|nr:T9SS type A sorting domain-containing protein [Bacteroidia bacterium]